MQLIKIPENDGIKKILLVYFIHFQLKKLIKIVEFNFLWLKSLEMTKISIFWEIHGEIIIVEVLNLNTYRHIAACTNKWVGHGVD